MRRVHGVVLGLWAVVVVVVTTIILPKWPTPPDASLLHATREQLLRDPVISDGGIVVGMTSGTGGARTWVRVNVTTRAGGELDQVMPDVARTVLDGYPAASSKDFLTVVVQRGYDIGIWSSWHRQQKTLRPEEWRRASIPR